MIYFADHRWWEWHRSRDGFKSFKGERIAIFDTAGLVDDPSVHLLRNEGTEGLPKERNALHTGQNSGYQALSLAILAGASRIILVGYDMRFKDGRSHWHEDHPVHVGEAVYSFYAKRFNTLVGVSDAAIINATPDSLIDCFPRGDLESLLPDPA